MNILQLLFLLMTVPLIIFGSLINLLESRLPLVLRQSFRYGKFAVKDGISDTVIEVPKSWFKHFYVLAVIVYTYLFYLVNLVYVFHSNVPDMFLNFLNLVGVRNSSYHIPEIKIYLAVLLMLLQVYRRFYDTHYISVFGKNSYINFLHYVVGLMHYPGTALAIVSEAPGFTTVSTDTSKFALDVSDLTYWDILATALFLCAWWHQHTCTKILAQLRRDKKGNIISHVYKLPEGDWFKYLSAPHQNAEILMYFSLVILLWYHVTWFFVFAWVFSNQVETILLSHWWYQEKFAEFPKERKALIPFLY